METFLRSSKHSIHKMNHHVLNLLISTSDYLVALCDSQNPIFKVDDSAKKQLVKVFKAQLQRLLLELRSRFDVYQDQKFCALSPGILCFTYFESFYITLQAVKVI